MPWQPDGRFIRENPTFSGDDVWQQDQQAGYKVIDQRHDFHDEDLARGIANTLNIDGYNAMRADLDMGGFNIINMAMAGDEEMKDGIWTPQLPLGMVPGGNLGGIWLKSGRLVMIMADIQWVSVGTADPSAALQITNLPFAIASPGSGTNKMYHGNYQGWQGLVLADNSSYVFIRGMQVIDSLTVRPITYWAANNPPNDPSTEPNDEIVQTFIGQLLPSGEFTFNFTYLTNDPDPA